MNIPFPAVFFPLSLLYYYILYLYTKRKHSFPHILYPLTFPATFFPHLCLPLYNEHTFSRRFLSLISIILLYKETLFPATFLTLLPFLPLSFRTFVYLYLLLYTLYTGNTLSRNFLPLSP